MRHHIVRFLVETEQSYVHSLRTILKVSSCGERERGGKGCVYLQ